MWSKSIKLQWITIAVILSSIVNDTHIKSVHAFSSIPTTFGGVVLLIDHVRPRRSSSIDAASFHFSLSSNHHINQRRNVIALDCFNEEPEEEHRALTCSSNGGTTVTSSKKVGGSGTNKMTLSRRDSLLRSATVAAIAVACGGGGGWWTTIPLEGSCSSSVANAAAVRSDDDDSFAAIAARASKITQNIDEEATKVAARTQISTDKNIYDFSLPVRGQNVPLRELIRQEVDNDSVNVVKDDIDGGRNGGDDKDKYKKDPRVKAVLVVNIKQDDPIARKTIPDLITLAAKYGRGDNAPFVVIASPTDQGYYEPDTSQLIRLKLESEYGYGINPSTCLTDKVILLGTGAHPFWRWIQGTCRTPAGLGRIESNFEKFLVDGRTGLPLRRYPRKYSALDITDDIEALIAGRPLPPPRANWLETWRSAAVEAERDTYRFEKGLNYFDQEIG